DGEHREVVGSVGAVREIIVYRSRREGRDLDGKRDAVAWRPGAPRNWFAGQAASTSSECHQERDGAYPALRHVHGHRPIPYEPITAYLPGEFDALARMHQLRQAVRTTNQ